VAQPTPLPIIWLQATRPKTLAAGLVPVVVGTALSGFSGPINWQVAAACLIGALLIQIGTNFANDAFDALKGADTPDRLGPQRAVASGLISARAMLIATAVVLTCALLVGLYLSRPGGWPILVLGLISLVCAVAYTGGPFPLAYLGLGDVFVFLFFGLFAVLGSYWVQAAPHGRHHIDPVCVLIAEAVGLQATGIIAVNNLRDIATDQVAGKRTLAVRLGDRASRIYIILLHVASTGCLAIAALLLRSWPLAVPAVVAGAGGGLLCLGLVRAHGAALNRYLSRSAALELITGLCLAIALTMAARCAAG
jgi:1,4-dihydroxy-2-naphthoate octaprenyltransferase